ncbi:regulatory signaling modulator protein AmpE [Coxiella-like endosymbiont]|uniref:regulatory signaling modulator protein AmpE n=1 Tax=Coxiella-like endosymbiont TaxID=1592897 RepID=UPI00272C08C4|nr:regulatory signaling modulator protein AmpE [Coxiella-like endosymbiont]
MVEEWIAIAKKISENETHLKVSREWIVIMALTAILLCLVIQWWLHFDSYSRQYHWFDAYFHWMKERFEHLSFWRGIGGVGIVVLPLLLIYILIALFVCHLLTIVGYYFLTVVVLWYCMDTRSHAPENIAHVTVEEVLINAYRRIFALIFWLLILGSTGVVLYTLVANLNRHLGNHSLEEDNNLYLAARRIEGVLDWVPVRLTGITFALVGYFSATFKRWYSYVYTGIASARQQIIEYGLTALGIEESHPLLVEKLVAIDGLINRALWVWLVVIALFTIGRWIG